VPLEGAPAPRRFPLAGLQNGCRLSPGLSPGVHLSPRHPLVGARAEEVASDVIACPSGQRPACENTSLDRQVHGRPGPRQAPALATSAPKTQRRRFPGRAPTCLSMRGCSVSRESGFDGKHRTRSIQQNALGIGPQDQLADRSAPAQTDHDEVGVNLIGHLDQVL